ncbi:hypothetical protein M0812_02566 [Anaeramoeba flamelloides]|uniref:Nucleoplasmin-like domain-containing protein n=1 Tax=Anaeramoeba flamelloides TaxID=1746091 RepID=A0AAV7YMD5_9EUKA|nr:hypothetical protein M0812_02566 [Anaeramoeba flamelloides]
MIGHKGLTVIPKKKYTCQLDYSMTLVSVSLDPKAKIGERASLFLMKDDIKFLLCTLRQGVQENFKLDLPFFKNEKITFYSESTGKSPLNLVMFHEGSTTNSEDDSEIENELNEKLEEELETKIEKKLEKENNQKKKGNNQNKKGNNQKKKVNNQNKKGNNQKKKGNNQKKKEASPNKKRKEPSVEEKSKIQEKELMEIDDVKPKKKQSQSKKITQQSPKKRRKNKKK